MIFIGFDSSNYGQQLAYNACVNSIRKYNKTIDLQPVIRKELIDKKLFKRKDNDGSTEFTYTRFLVPFLNKYNGWCLFFDSDFIWNCDPYELFDKYNNTKYAVYCVKHQYTECTSNLKMNGLKQEWYPKKNWSSLMLFNCSHPSIKNLNLDNINKKSARWLHRFEWCNESEIGEIDKSYNYLVNYYNDNKFKALHYTDGGPWYPGNEKCLYHGIWLKNINSKEKNLLNEYLNNIYSENIF